MAADLRLRSGGLDGSVAAQHCPRVGAVREVTGQKMKMIGLMAGAALLAAACASSGSAGPRPPQGVGPGGTDFGQWRYDAEGALDAAFRSFITGRYDADDVGRAQDDLTTDGFECQDGNRPEGRPVPELECIRVYQLNEDVHAWSVEFWADDAEPRSRYTRTRIMDRYGADDD